MKPVKVGKIPAILIILFVGHFGVHKFMSGYVGGGVLRLCTFGLFLVGTIMDLIKVCKGTYVDVNGEPWGVD